MPLHPDQIYRFDGAAGAAIRSAIGNRAWPKLRSILEQTKLAPDQLAAIARHLQIDDRLIILHEDAGRETKRDAFLQQVLDWADAAGVPAFQASIATLVEQIQVIEAGYRLISASICDLPISARPPERQLAAVYHRAAIDFDALHSRGPHFPKSADGSITFDGRVVVQNADGGVADFDAMTESLTTLLANCIDFLAHQRWSTTTDLDVPVLPVPSEEEIEQAAPLLALSQGWMRWQRWERQARYWGGSIRRLTGDAIPADVGGRALTHLFDHQRGDGDYFDWVAVERLKQVSAQDHHRLMRRPLRYVGETGAPLPPRGFVDMAECLAANLLFQGAYLDPSDITPRKGATIPEWLRGYSVLRRIAGEALEREDGPLDRHLLALSRSELTDRLVGTGLSPAGADAFVDGVTYSADSVDLFDAPLLRQGPDRFLLFGPTAANIDAGRAILSNLPNLGESLEHKGTLFERAVAAFFTAIGLPVFTPNRKFGTERYQVDVLVQWGTTLFLFECKNTAPSNLHPKLALDFEQRRGEDLYQVKRLVAGLSAHPEILTDLGGPDPNRLTIVPVLLYAMPFAKAGPEDGVYSTDWSILSRFFERGDLGSENHFDSGDEVDPVTHRQVTERIWRGVRPTLEDLLRALETPWPFRLIEARTRLGRVYAQLAPHQVARSTDYVAIALARAEIAELYGFRLRDWERGLERAEQLANRRKKRRAEQELIRQTRLGRRRMG